MATFSTVSESTDWSSASFINEIAEALEERSQAVFSAAVSFQIAVGADVQSASFWSAMQAKLNEIAIWFCDPDIDLAAMDDSGDPGAAVPNTHNRSLAEWRSASGLHSSGFRRATSYPSDWTDLSDTAYSYGVMQAGDIMGPWIFVDLQNGIKSLVSIVTQAEYVHYLSPGPVSHKGRGVSSGKTTVADALVSAQSSWNYIGWGPCYDVGPPSMYANVEYTDSKIYIYTGKSTGHSSYATRMHNSTSCTVHLFDFYHGNHGFNVIAGGPGTYNHLLSVGQVGEGVSLGFYVGESPGGNRMPALDAGFAESGPNKNYSLTLSHAVFRTDFAFKWESGL